MSIDHRVNFENREMYERVKYICLVTDFMSD